MKGDEKIARLVPRGAPRGRKAKRGCPICGRPPVAGFRPFCSERCRRVDLDRWLSEAYRVPGEAVRTEDKEPEEE